MPEQEVVRSMTVVEALALVMEDVREVGKTGRNTQQNYSFRGIDAVVNAVGPAFRKYGVICVPVSVQHESEHYKTSNDKQMKGVTVLVGFRFYGPAGDYIEAFASGEAADAGDKATPKAHSVAFRTVLLQALCIPTDEPDPDQESHERAVERRVERQGYPVPKSWPEIEAGVRACDNADEAWALFEAFIRAAAYHLFGKADSSVLTQDQKTTIAQKSAGAVVWLHENVSHEGPFFFFDEAAQRRAWAAMLDGGPALQIPDYVAPVKEPELSPEERELAEQALDQQAADAAAESEPAAGA